MRYTSTRSRTISVSFEQALCTGYAPDRGLFVPESLPGGVLTSARLSQWSALSYPLVSYEVLRLFIAENEISNDDLQQICIASFEGFDNPSQAVPIVPLQPISTDPKHINQQSNKTNTSSLYMAELFHGPTFCFKDLGMRVVIHLLRYFVARRSLRMTLLVSTTGDTGPAAVQAVAQANTPYLTLLVHYPHEQISAFQRKQMTTCQSNYVKVVAFEGGGDDMDLPIKNILAGQTKKEPGQLSKQEQTNEEESLLTGVNSYNIGRPLMQMVHYIWTYMRVVELERAKETTEDEPPTQTKENDDGNCDREERSPLSLTIILPTGAMGNIAGGYMAKQMGLPVTKLIACTNVNDISHRVIQTGQYIKSPHMIKTLSEAINVQLPYNFERLLFYLTNQNHDLVAAWMTQVEEDPDAIRGRNQFLLSSDWLTRLQQEFDSASVTDEEMCETIRYFQQEYQYVPDPHTAVALCGARKLGYTQKRSEGVGTTREQTNNNNNAKKATAILATASPCKFQETMMIALGEEGWLNYAQSDRFPLAAKRYLEANEVSPILYAADPDKTLQENQAVWEQKARQLLQQWK